MSRTTLLPFGVPILLLCCWQSNLSGELRVPAVPRVEGGSGQTGQQQEEQEDYYAKWLREDVVYIITQAERDVFEKLSNPDEKDQFIEQFWHRRDPDLRSALNEFKEEHYRRLAYSNERFTSGVPGWKTDRGRIYIIHGPPAEIEKHFSGESYQRPSHEGGGFTSVVPFEIWRYRHIEGLGPDVELEFVDPTRSGEFRLARNPWEKDELLVIGTGATTAESLGLMQRGDHPYFTYTNWDRYPGMSSRAKDNPFTRYETLIKVQSPQEIKYQDLKQIVDVDIRYDNLPFETRHDYFRLNDTAILAAITLQIDNQNLTFELENGVWVARIALYGIVTSMTNRVVTEFEQDLQVSYSPQDLEQGREGRSVYQKILPVEKRMRHRVDLVVKDLNSGNLGVKRQAIIPPPYDAATLSVSSLVLSDHILALPQVDPEEMFAIGDIKVRPSLGNVFACGNPLGAYLHVYNAGLDQARLAPDLKVRYQLLKGDALLREGEAGSGSILYFSGDRVVLVLRLPVDDLPSDRYQLRLEIHDRVLDRSVSVIQSFRLESE